MSERSKNSTQGEASPVDVATLRDATTRVLQQLGEHVQHFETVMCTDLEDVLRELEGAPVLSCTDVKVRAMRCLHLIRTSRTAVRLH